MTSLYIIFQVFVESLDRAFENVCEERGLKPVRDNAHRELVAERVIEFAQRGITDPQRLREVVLSKSSCRPSQLAA